MPTLFISYKRGTSAVAPLMENLKAAHYHLWFDRDEIHLGDDDWQKRIDQGLGISDGMILCLTPSACTSIPVQYEVKKARELNKPIFPLILEQLPKIEESLREVGLPEKQHCEDFTNVEQWSAQIERLLRDLRHHGLRVTPHDKRKERGTEEHALHQRYLKRLVDQIGTIDFANINPSSERGVNLEDVYIRSPSNMGISTRVDNWQISSWWVENNQSTIKRGMIEVEEESYSRTRQDISNWSLAHLEALLYHVENWISDFRKQHPEAKPEDRRWNNPWNNSTKWNILPLDIQHVATACPRLVILGAPGSGKSTFVRHLALCLAGNQIDNWHRPNATHAQLGQWTHGDLTPIYIQLRQFVASAYFPSDMSTMPTLDHLWAYIENEILKDDLIDYSKELKYDLEHGHAILILDGLDEVPYPEGKLKDRQAQLSTLATSLNNAYPQSRVLVASRPHAYEGWRLPDFQSVTIAPFEDDHRINLAQRLYQVKGMSPESAFEKAEALNAQLRNIDPELKDRPLFVTLMATIFLEGEQEGLPTRRGALYRQSILLLLDRWTKSKPNSLSLNKILGDLSLETLYSCLAELAFNVHQKFRDKPGTPEIDYYDILRYFRVVGRDQGNDHKVISYLSGNAGILVSPGQNQERDVFHFAHRSFQEYLAAEHIVNQCNSADNFELVGELIITKPDLWREPCQFVGDILANSERASDLWILIDDLLTDDTPKTSEDLNWWRVWLASQITQEQNLNEQKLRRGEKAIRDALIVWQVNLISTPLALNPPERAHCGQTLGLLGDPRKGVGLDENGLPDIGWVTIPDDGVWIYQDKEHEPLPTFQIARYPITYLQFQAFVDAPDGINDSRWWEGFPQTAQVFRQVYEQAFEYWNHPRDNVNWYQAMAFCRWLSYKLGGKYGGDKIMEWTVRLPTDKEWQKVASGKASYKYPWGNEFDLNKTNIDETGIKKTSAVGLFPRGSSSYQVLDMLGNVWEWCLDGQTLIGEAYDSPTNGIALADRAWSEPHIARANFGFRCICAI